MLMIFFRLPRSSRGMKDRVTQWTPVTLMVNVDSRSSLEARSEVSRYCGSGTYIVAIPPGVRGATPALLISTSKPLLSKAFSTSIAASLI